MQGCMHKYVAAGNIVRKLLILESERGPLSGFQPAVSEVVEYLNSVSLPTVRINVLIVLLVSKCNKGTRYTYSIYSSLYTQSLIFLQERDVEMRTFLYSLLAAEGSAKSQEVCRGASVAE